VLRAEGRGFNAGVDIKELQAAAGFTALLEVSRGCFAAFKAIYECAVPVIAAVHGYCLGGGIGLVGNSDVIIAADDATFGLPEVDRGALGAATHLSRLVRSTRRGRWFTPSATATAGGAAPFRLGVLRGPGRRAPRGRARLRWAGRREGPARHPPGQGVAERHRPVDVNRSYRYEQGFTFELNLAGAGDRARDEFVAGPTRKATR